MILEKQYTSAFKKDQSTSSIS